ncbi:MAG: CHAP domain-containing protein [Acetobacteraceae bacterium]
MATAILLAAPDPLGHALANTPNPASSRSGASAPFVQCVPFARHLSGIDIMGDARTWWAQAEGRYDRGSRPEIGSVLTFRPSGGMRLGHVSVVTRIVSPREILVDHANWPGPGVPKGRVARGVSVIDVSDRNDWTLVRVEIHGRGSGYGRAYPSWGFIYPRGPATETAARSPLPAAVERLNARAAIAASRPPAFVGQSGAGLVGNEPIELAEAAARGGTRRDAAAMDRASSLGPRDFGEEIAVWGAPDRSLR